MPHAVQYTPKASSIEKKVLAFVRPRRRSFPFVASTTSEELELPEQEAERPETAEPLPGPGLRQFRRCGDRRAAGSCQRVDFLADGCVLTRINRKERRRGSPGGELGAVIAGLLCGLRVGFQLVQRNGMDETMAPWADQKAGCDRQNRNHDIVSRPRTRTG